MQRADGRVPPRLGELLDAAVQVADDGLARDDLLAVELEDEPQDAVSRGVLRAHVEHEVLGARSRSTPHGDTLEAGRKRGGHGSGCGAIVGIVVETAA